MISKFLSKLKSILFKSAVTSESPLKKEKKAAKSAKTKTKTKTKTKSVNSKKNIETLTTLPGVGAKSAKALYCLLYTSPSPRDRSSSRMPSSA